MKIAEYWVTSDYILFTTYNEARYHEIVLKLRKLIKHQILIINKGN
jgi:hypothetical protein